MVMRVMPELLYGKDHPYGMPMTGTGEEDALRSMTTADVQKFYDTWLRPNNATIVVTGDISMPELLAKLEKRLSSWQKGTTPTKVIPEVKNANNGKIFLLDRPESPQSLIMAAYLTQPYGKVDEAAIEQMNNVLGGDFTSRINMNIREDKRWSYGARSMIMNTSAQRPFVVVAPVQTDKTSESVQEVIKEVQSFVGDKPMTEQEFTKTKQNTVMGMSGMWETNGAVNGSVRNIVRYNLPDNYWQEYAGNVEKLALKDVHNAAKSIVQPNSLGWFLAGDAAKVLPGLEKLGMEIIQIDAEGKRVSKKGKP
jgi:predicted Zn-dependent peptidase